MQRSVLLLGLDLVDLPLDCIELALLECNSRQFICLLLELNFVVGDVLAELFKVRQILVVVIKCRDHCLEELIIAETAAPLSYAVRVKHG